MDYKLNTITKIPNYLDGKFDLFEIKQYEKGKFPVEYLKDSKKSMFFQELSITDKLQFEAEQRDRKLTMKIRIPQTKEITALNVLKIGDKYHKVYNAYHFTNKEGFKETDLTLEIYPNVILEDKIC